MNFRELTYNKLQSECKLRGIKANQKTIDLITALEEYELSKKKVIKETNAADPVFDFVDPYALESFALFDIPVNEVTVSDNEVIQPTVEVVSTKPVTPVKLTTSQLPQSNVTKNVSLTYEQLESFYDKGFICLNNNTRITGIDARIILSKLWSRYPVIQQYLTDYDDHTSLLRVNFALSKEVTEAKKVVKKGRNLIPATVEIGDPKVRTIYVGNDRGNDLGLPSDKRSPYKSGLKHGIIDHTSCSSIYIDDKLIYSLTGSVLKLQSEAYSKSGRSKEHKADCGYIGKSKNTKNKRNTGVKLTSSIQIGVNTNLRGNLFKLAGQTRPMQVEISNHGILYLNQYMSNGQKVTTTIGQIKERDQLGRYQIEYSTGYKLHDNSVIDRHIQQLINKATHHDMSFLMNDKVAEPDHTHQLQIKQATNNSKRATRKDKYDNNRYRQANFTSF